MADYDPTPLLSNPIACMTSWLGGILRSPTPSYQPAPPPPPPPPPVPTVARVRGIVTERAAITAADGEYCGDGPIAVLTLVVDDAETAATVLEALHHGAQIRVTTAGAYG